MSFSTSSRSAAELLLGLLQGEGELLVLRDRLGELPLALEEPLLERLHPSGALLEAAPERVDLVFGLDQAGAEDLQVGVGTTVS